jgi:hypothetical protein
MGTSDLDDLEEIAEQTKLRVNKRTKHGGKFGWAVSPNIAHTAVQREKKKVAMPAPSDVTPAAPPIVSTHNRATLGRLFTDYRTLVETCRARADELEISRSEIDRIGGLPSGYAGKLLGKNGGEPGRKNKKMWPFALESMLGVLGLKILLIEDDVAAARTRALATPVDRANQRFGNVCHLSTKLLPPPSQPASPPVLTVVSAKRSARRGKYG